MNATTAAESLLALLTTEQRTSARAILLTGPWGCGKTYVWKQLVAPQLKNPSVYVSAFGAEGPDALKSRLLTQFALRSVTRADFLQTEKANTVGKKLTKVIGRPGKAITAFLESAGGAMLKHAGIDPLEFAEFLNEHTVICIDDIERTSDAFPVSDVLAIANVLTEHKHLDVVLICDETRIGESDPAKREAYVKSKEKTISSDLHLSADLLDMYERLLANVVRSPSAREYALASKDTVIDVFSRAKTQNLRLLAKAFARVESLLAAGVPALSAARLRLLCALTIRSAERPLEKAEFFDFNDFALRISERMDTKKPPNATRAAQIQFVDTYFGDEGSYSFDAGIYALVQRGEVDAEHFKRLAAPKPQPSTAEVAYEKLTSGEWKHMNDEGVRAVIDELVASLRTPTGFTATQVLDILAFARFLANLVRVTLPQDLAPAALAQLQAAVKAQGATRTMHDIAWDMRMGDFARLVESEIAFLKEESERVRKSALEDALRSAIESRDLAGFLNTLDRSQLDGIQALCDDVGIDVLMGVRKTDPKFFWIALQALLKDLAQYRAIWPDAQRHRERCVAQLQTIASSEGESFMDRWRAEQLAR
jgi:hypothetical protein